MTRLAHLRCAFCSRRRAARRRRFPSKPIRVIIPFVAGGSSDIVGRAIGSKFQEFLGQPGVVENKPGANGAIAAEFVAKADPDGHTILVGSIGVFSINAALFKDLRYNPLRDFAPITLAVTTPNVLITKPALAANSMKELVDYAKKNPGKLSYCSSGTGSSDHLTAELLKQMRGHVAVHVPYKGGAACQTDIMGNQVDYLVPEPRRGDQLHQGQPHEGARGHGEDAPSAAAERPDGGRGRLPRPRGDLVAGGGGAGQDAARDRRAG